MNPQILELIGSATEVVDSSVVLPRARFALNMGATDLVAKAEEIRIAFAPLGGEVRPLSKVERLIWVLWFPDRVFTAEDAVIFQAAYRIQEEFALEAAEPDLPTNFFPDGGRVSTDGKGPARESTIRSLCFTPAQDGLSDNWALDAMRVKEAWAFSVQQMRPDGGEGVIIAQPDTGITGHIELRGVTQVDPRDVLDGDNDATDPLDDIGNPGHGTGTGSVVVSPESNRVAGSAPKAKHMPIRAIQSVVRITQVTVAEAIDWAVDHGSHVITMSLGGIPSFALHRAVRRAVAADVVVLAAAGNCVRVVVWPARYDDCIAVAAVNSNGEPWRGTCRGAAVDVSAPGENVFRADVGEETVTQGQGTSFAVALTAGIAALWVAHHGRANLIGAARSRGETLQAMFRRLLRATARRPEGWDSFNMGAGIVDARALLEADLSLQRGLESAPQPDRDEDRGRIAVESLVLETLGEEALAPGLDWSKFGPEIATALFRARLDQIGTDGGAELEAGSIGAVPSESLRTDPAAQPLLAHMMGGSHE